MEENDSNENCTWYVSMMEMTIRVVASMYGAVFAVEFGGLVSSEIDLQKSVSHFTSCSQLLIIWW